jgi:hypothetical protein
MDTWNIRSLNERKLLTACSEMIMTRTETLKNISDEVGALARDRDSFRRVVMRATS